jgi:hypothetical protein
MLALLAAFISFCIVRNNITFAFYFFVTSRTANQTPPEVMDQTEPGQRYSFKMQMRLMHLNFLTPILIVLLYCDELTGSNFTGVMSLETWHLARVLPVFLLAMLRVITFKEELQFQFD